ncbi:MAG: ArsA family ATPase [Deltaproteobacteria bacterium]|nr:ArsA family ATPase [Deltaproteobacteria bacterium]
MPDLAPLVATHRVLVCVGSGGVGKTTTAAAFALWGALGGRRTAVVTIDPAKRLADCLGLSTLALREEPLPAETFARYGLAPSGTLTALLVDQQSAWDTAVARYAPTSEIRERILANRFYQGLSRTFAGSHEYMALDTLATLVQRGVYDLIVVDTPPTRQALDFLEAPQRVQRFLDSQASKWLIRSSLTSGWAALSAVHRTATFLLRKIEDATGISALGEISEFFTDMQRMFEDFGERFGRVSELLASADTAFVLVTSPEEEVLAEAEEFRAGLERLGVALKGVVVNRVHGEWPDARLERQDAAALTERLRQGLHLPSGESTHLQWLAENFLAYQALARGEELRLEHFRRGLPARVPLVRVPALPAFPADLGGLGTLHGYLFSSAVSVQRKQRKR